MGTCVFVCFIYFILFHIRKGKKCFPLFVLCKEIRKQWCPICRLTKTNIKPHPIYAHLIECIRCKQCTSIFMHLDYEQKTDGWGYVGADNMGGGHGLISTTHKCNLCAFAQMRQYMIDP